MRKVALGAALLVSGGALSSSAQAQWPDPQAEEAHPQDEGGSATSPAYDDDGEEAPEALSAAPTGRRSRVHMHAVGLGYHNVFFRTENSERFALHGPSIVYDYFVGKKWGFMMRGAAYFPAYGRMTGGPATSPNYSGSLRDDYPTRRFGFDGLLMAAYRQELSERLVLYYAGGVHVQSFALNGVDFSPIEAITMGFGGVGRLEWLIHRVVHLGAELMIAIDPFDLIDHRNKAVLTLPVAGSLSAGIRF